MGFDIIVMCVCLKYPMVVYIRIIGLCFAQQVQAAGGPKDSQSPAPPPTVPPRDRQRRRQRGGCQWHRGGWLIRRFGQRRRLSDVRWQHLGNERRCVNCERVVGDVGGRGLGRRWVKRYRCWWGSRPRRWRLVSLGWRHHIEQWRG